MALVYLFQLLRATGAMGNLQEPAEQSGELWAWFNHSVFMYIADRAETRAWP